MLSIVCQPKVGIHFSYIFYCYVSNFLKRDMVVRMETVPFFISVSFEVLLYWNRDVNLADSLLLLHKNQTDIWTTVFVHFNVQNEKLLIGCKLMQGLASTSFSAQQWCTSKITKYLTLSYHLLSFCYRLGKLSKFQKMAAISWRQCSCCIPLLHNVVSRIFVWTSREKSSGVNIEGLNMNEENILHCLAVKFKHWIFPVTFSC